MVEVRSLRWLFFGVALLAAACSSEPVATSAAADADEDDTAASVSEIDSTESGDAATEIDTDDTHTDDTDTDGAESGGEALPSVEQVIFADDFAASILPIFENRCASCHQVGGPGTAHWTMATVADIDANRDLIWANIEAGVMPPWPASDLSVPFHDDRSLRDDELQAIVDWLDAGGEVDVALDSPVQVGTPLEQLERVDMELAPRAPYQGVPRSVDDYRCVVYEPELTEPMWLTGYEFVPDQAEVVHHAIGYLGSASDRDRAATLDGLDDQPGWECFGGSRLSDDEMFLGWAPGQDPTTYPDRSGLLLEPGDFIVVQIHYHFETYAPADASTIRLMLEPGDADLDSISIGQYLGPAEIPCSTEESGPLCDRDAAFADAVARFGQEGVQADFANLICGVTPADFAGMTDGTASSICDLPMFYEGTIVSVLGHQHEIGRTFRMTLNPGRPDERVLLDIPRWDFDWQYNYEPIEAIEVKGGDTVRLECSWDRSLIRPGAEPRYILWADGTNDEMCFATMVTRES